MRNIVDENWQRLKRRLRDFWNTLIGEKGVLAGLGLREATRSRQNA
jgi:hypothetical protein